MFPLVKKQTVINYLFYLCILFVPIGSGANLVLNFDVSKLFVITFFLLVVTYLTIGPKILVNRFGGWFNCYHFFILSHMIIGLLLFSDELFIINQGALGFRAFETNPNGVGNLKQCLLDFTGKFYLKNKS